MMGSTAMNPEAHLSRWQSGILIACAAFAGFAIPTSTAAQNIGSGLLLLCVLFIAPLRREIPRALREPFPLACLVLFAWMTLATLWSSAPWPDRLEMLERLRMFLVCPLLLATMRNQGGRRAMLIGFGTAALVSALISIGLAVTDISWLNTQRELGNWPVFRSHTYHDLFIAWLIIALVLALLSRALSRTLSIVAVIVIIVCAADALLLVRGRSAQVLLFAMLGWVALRWDARRVLPVTLIAMAIGLPSLYFGSAQVRESVALVSQNLSDYREGKIDNNSFGIRLEYYSNTLSLIRQAPLLGHGTGSLKHEYESLTGFTRETHSQRAAHNPHNDYLWLWSESGILGALALLGTVAAGLWQARRLPKAQRILSECLILSVASGTLINSFFTDNASGVGFMLLACALLAGTSWRPGVEERA